jgi:hypothetical protein
MIVYGTESIAAIAQQVAKPFQAAVVAHRQTGGRAVTIAEAETGMRQFLREVGLQSLSQFLSTGAATPVAEIACPCGGRLHYQRWRAATFTSVFGRLRYERAYYVGCRCGRGREPLDAQYGLQPGAVTAGWRRCSVWAALRVGLRRAGRGYTRFCGSTFRRRPFGLRHQNWRRCKSNGNKCCVTRARTKRVSTRVYATPGRYRPGRMAQWTPPRCGSSPVLKPEKSQKNRAQFRPWPAVSGRHAARLKFAGLSVSHGVGSGG